MLTEKEKKDRQLKKISMCVRSAHVTLCAWRLCVRAFVWHVAALHFSRNQEPDSISPDLLRAVECDRKHLPCRCVRTHAHLHTQPSEEQSNRTHTLPQASREEGSKGWWSHTTPTVDLPVTHIIWKSPLPVQPQKWNDFVMRYVIHSTPFFFFKSNYFFHYYEK